MRPSPPSCPARPDSARASSPEGVLHFAERWLPASEGFVYDLVVNLDRPRTVVARNPLENTDRFPLDGVRSLTSLVSPVPAAVRQKAITLSLLAIARCSGSGIVHVHHGYGIDSVLGLVRRTGMPLVVSFHGDDLTGHLEEHPGAYKRAIPLVDTVVVPSRYLAARALEVGFEGSRVQVVPTGVDTRYFEPTPLPGGDPVVLFVGRFVEKKGLDVLAAAWPLVSAELPDARLEVLGFGPLEHVARSIPGKVEVHLAPTRDQVREAIRRARVVVSPSRTAPGDSVESLLVVNLEAQASGRPVVTTRHGGIPEFVVEGETALVVPEADHAALARALLRVLVDEQLARRLASNGPGWVRTFDVRVAADRVGAVYEELLALRAPGREAPATGAPGTGAPGTGAPATPSRSPQQVNEGPMKALRAERSRRRTAARRDLRSSST